MLLRMFQKTCLKPIVFKCRDDTPIITFSLSNISMKKHPHTVRKLNFTLVVLCSILLDFSTNLNMYKMVNGIISVGIEAVMLVVICLDGINSQGLDGRRGAEIRCLTKEDKIEILKAHNDYRRSSNSSNIMKMEWSDDLETMSQQFVDNCKAEHNSAENLIDNLGFRHIGENLFVSPSDHYQVKEAVDNWHSEIENYNYSTADCDGVCGHYTQVVWYNSYALGCGLIWCSELQNSPQIKSGILLICNYGPSGNAPSERPYQEGEACSNCSTTASICNDDLCSASLTTPPTNGNCPARQTTSISGSHVLEGFAIFLFASGVILIISSLQYFRFSGKSDSYTDKNVVTSSTT